MKRITLFVGSLLFAAGLVAGNEVIKRGAAIPADARTVALSDVLAKPADYQKTPVVVEGVIEKNCTNKGCWMELAPEKGKNGVRVTFKDYGFFIPLDSKGMRARAEGVTVTKQLSKKEADHLEGEGAKLARNADGTASEVSFIANGVELRKAQ
jgi:hypothetical protein